MKRIKLILILFITLIFTNCAEDFVEVTPTRFAPGENLIIDANSAQSAINGMYSSLQGDYLYGGYNTYTTGLYSDNLAHTGSFPTFAELAGNNPALNNGSILSYWNGHYATIYRANRIISEVTKLSIPAEQKNNFIAQARAVRALTYYKLVKVFGGVPIEEKASELPADIDNRPIPRSTKTEVYNFIMSDITFALNNLNEVKNTYYFSQNSARVLKAKIEMELGKYSDAKTTLAPVLGSYSLSSDYNSLFNGSADPSEAILAIDYNDTDGGTQAFFFLRAGRGEVGPSSLLLAAFETNDLRKGQFNSNGEINKYKDPGNGSDDVYIYRYADVLLMQAELLAREAKYTDASKLVNEVRKRAGLPNITLNPSNYIDLIVQERRVEFYAETSDRLFTLTRLGIADKYINSTTKPNSSIIAERNYLWPIPQQEIERNSAINTGDQNPGY